MAARAGACDVQRAIVWIERRIGNEVQIIRELRSDCELRRSAALRVALKRYINFAAVHLWNDCQHAPRRTCDQSRGRIFKPGVASPDLAGIETLTFDSHFASRNSDHRINPHNPSCFAHLTPLLYELAISRQLSDLSQFKLSSVALNLK